MEHASADWGLPGGYQQVKSVKWLLIPLNQKERNFNSSQFNSIPKWCKQHCVKAISMLNKNVRRVQLVRLKSTPSLSSDLVDLCWQVSGVSHQHLRPKYLKTKTKPNFKWSLHAACTIANASVSSWFLYSPKNIAAHNIADQFQCESDDCNSYWQYKMEKVKLYN